jgi:HPt (histidine-containing phosphotransfer) domain-containing protein
VPENESSPPRLDLAALDALAEGIGADRVRRVIGVYLATAKDTRAALERQLQAGELDLLRKSLHSLKSSTLGIGGLRLGRLAAELEAAAREGKAETFARIPEVIGELDAFCGVLAPHGEPARRETAAR